MPLERPIANDAWRSHELVTDFMVELGRDLSRERGYVSVLDVGSGRYGSGRVNLENALIKIPSKIMLHDPHESVQPSYNAKTVVIDDRELTRLHEDEIDWINLSYVLSHVGDMRAAVDTVIGLTSRFPNAMVTVTDYTLKDRDKSTAMDVLTQTNVERQERMLFADDEAFLATHMAHTKYTIEKILTNCAFMRLIESAHTDGANARAFVAARP